ncbi:hypothetical protein NM96_13340 [Neisseria mucosa]|nr:hypothetical protein NM96_13340 [Neisseria mucosa]
MREREGRLKNQPQRLPSFPPPPKRGQAAAGMTEAARQLFSRFRQNAGKAREPNGFQTTCNRCYPLKTEY